MMCISNQVSGLALVSVAGTLAVQKKKKFSLQALHVTVCFSFSFLLFLLVFSLVPFIYFFNRKLLIAPRHTSSHTEGPLPASWNS